MGLKYLETVKSVTLVFLIILSVTLTFSIWTYTPKYKTSEQSTTISTSIVDEDKKEIKGIKDIIKPYKLLFNFEEGMKGTTDSDALDESIEAMKKWKITDVTLADAEFTDKELDVFLRKKNRFTLYYHGEVPLPVYDVVLNKEDSNFPEASFDRLVVDWNPASTALEIHFISRLNGLRYTGKVTDYQSFNRKVLPNGRSYLDYVEVNPDKSPFIAVPTNPIELIRNTYYQAEISPRRFKDALFRDPNAVRRGQISSSREEYQDDHAIMRIETMMKTLSFFHPVAESTELAIPSDLLFNTIDFVNEHGGWTDEYRYTFMNPKSRTVKFQLFVHGLPVYSDSTYTEIEEIWGDEGIYGYIRPYYTLNLTFPSETRYTSLPSGVEVAEALENSKEIDFSTVEEIEIGYYMRHDTDQRLFLLDPSWFYFANGKWNLYSPEALGGEKIGLE